MGAVRRLRFFTRLVYLSLACSLVGFLELGVCLGLLDGALFVEYGGVRLVLVGVMGSLRTDALASEPERETGEGLRLFLRLVGGVR